MTLKPEYHKPVEENKKLEATKKVPIKFLSCSLLPKQKTKLVNPKYTHFAKLKQPNQNYCNSQVPGETSSPFCF